MSQRELVAAAGRSREWYRLVLRNPEHASERTLRLLERSMDTLAADRANPKTETLALIAGVYGGFLVAVCREFDLDPDAVRAQDPRLGATADRHWRALAQARQVAMYLTNITLDVRQFEVAKVVNLTRAAVCQALKTVEDLRDDPAFDAVLIRVSRHVTGREAV